MQATSKKPSSYFLGRYLTSLAGIVVMPVLLMALVFGAIFVTMERDRLRAEALRTVQGMVGGLDHEFNGLIAILQALATSPSLDTRDFELFREQTLPLAKDRSRAIVLRDASGKPIVNTEFPWGQPLPASEFAADAAAAESGAPFISGVTKEAGTLQGDHWHFSITLPIRKSGKLTYFLSLIIDPNQITTLFQKDTLPPSWIWGMTDKNTRIVSRSIDAPSFIGREGSKDTAERASKPSGVFVTTNMLGKEIMYAYARSPLSGWRLGIAIPREEIEAPLWRMLTVWGLLTSIIITAAIIAVVLVNSRLRASVRSLINVSQQLGQSGTVDPVITGVKEFDRVAESVSAASIILREKTMQIRENEGRLRTLLDNLFVYVGLLDLNGRLLEANAAPMKAAGLQRDDVIGRPLWETYWWSWSPAIKDQLEKAVRDAAQGRTVRFDTDIRMAGGVLHTIDFQLAPLRAGDGSITYLLPSAVDITDRKAAEQKLQDSVSQLEATYVAAPVGLFLLDKQLRFIAVNRHQALINGKSIEEHIGKTLRDVMGEDTKQLEPHLRKVIKTGKPIDKFEFTATDDKDPLTVRTFLASYHPLISQRGDILGVSAAVHEITDRKLSEERQKILARELQHRVKNNLATVQAIARATIRSAKTLEEFSIRFSERISSLARTHTLVTETGLSGADLRQIIRNEITPYDEEMKRISIDGPPLRLPTESALTLGMAVHELVTNAVKHGALSNMEGHVKASWNIDAEGLTLHWSESGGPKVLPPKTKGFGSQLLQKILVQQLKGEVEMKFEPDGLSATIKIPAASLAPDVVAEFTA